RQFETGTPPPLPSHAPPPLRSGEGSENPASTQQVARLAGRSFLVVDDDVRNLYAMTSLLERIGASAIPAASASEGFKVLEQHPEVDAVLMDMMMPEMDGYAATRKLREDPRYADL